MCQFYDHESNAIQYQIPKPIKGGTENLDSQHRDEVFNSQSRFFYDYCGSPRAEKLDKFMVSNHKLSNDTAFLNCPKCLTSVHMRIEVIEKEVRRRLHFVGSCTKRRLLGVILSHCVAYRCQCYLLRQISKDW